MLLLFDLGGEYWRNYYGAGGSTQAYDLTLEKLEWYRNQFERFVVCCDSRSKRCDWYPEYKANRKERPRDAYEALESVEERVSKWKVPVLKCEGYEADDLIATLSDQAFLEDVRIVSNDKDLYQLITETTLIATRNGEHGEKDCVDKFGVSPMAMGDWLALVGDSADNVQGCPGVGPGKASALLQRFGSIEFIKKANPLELGSIPKIGPKLVKNILDWDPTLALKLVTLMRDAPVRLNELWKP